MPAGGQPATPMRPIIVFDLAETLISGMLGIEIEIARIEESTPEAVGALIGSAKLWDLFRGHCSPEEYFSHIAAIGNWKRFKFDDFSALVHRAFLRPVDGMPQFVTELSESCDLYLLTDHHVGWIEFIEQNHPFLNLFRRIFVSQRLRAVKRDGTPFEIVQSEINPGRLRPIAFVDDSAHNVETAKRYGFTGFHFKNTASLRAPLTEWIVAACPSLAKRL